MNHDAIAACDKVQKPAQAAICGRAMAKKKARRLSSLQP